MRRTIVVSTVMLALTLTSEMAQAQGVTSEYAQLVGVNSVLFSIAEAVPPPAPLLRAKIVHSNDYAVHVSDGDVTVTTLFLREASRNALAAAIVYQIVADPVHFAIVMQRAGFDGVAGLAELHHRLQSVVVLESWQRAATAAAYQGAVGTVNDNSFWHWARPGFHLMYRATMDAATAQYYQAARTQLATPRMHVLPIVPAETVAAVNEISAVLRGADLAGLSPWRPHIEEALNAYRPPAAAAGVAR